MKKKNVSSIGGQAILEGVMMKGKSSMAMAVRNPDKEIVIESKRLEQSATRKKISKIPIVRGIVSFVESFLSGLQITMRSSEVFGDMSDEAPSKFEKWLAKTFKVDIMNVVLAVGGILGVLFSVALFVLLPQIIALAIFAGSGLLEVNFDNGVWNAFQTSTDSLGFWWNMLYEVIRGFVRILIFISYIALVGRMKEIKRLFMYHGAEHKVISCYEEGLELTVENAKKMSTKHDRCGTTFMFIVMLFSMLFFTVVPVSMITVGNGALTFIVQFLIRVALIPVIAGVSYELLKLFAKYDNIFTRIGKAPGLWLQRLSTKEPEDDMLEVSIAAFTEVMKLEADPEYPTKTFVTYSTVEKVVAILEKTLNNKTEAEIIVMNVINAKNRTELYDGRRVENEQVKRCKQLAENRLTGTPLQYVLGSTCFYGYDFNTDTRALIPRFDTEIIVEHALKLIKERNLDNVRVLDLCTGSGCIAITVKKEMPSAVVVATDISAEALSLAKKNATSLGAEVTFLTGNLFNALKDEAKFDFIISNPPYIPTADLSKLDKEVVEYEPKLALDGGVDGLDFYKKIRESFGNYLKDDGIMLLEIGVNQAEAVMDIFKGFDCYAVEDYNNPPIKRVIVVKNSQN